MRHVFAFALLLALGALPLPAIAGTVVLDSMTGRFPANPCLPVTQQPILFLGSVCDGADCPPGTLVSSGCPGAQSVMQFGPAGVHPAVVLRRAEITGGFQATAWVDPGQALLHFEDVGASFLSFQLAYSTSPLDLTAMGANAIRVPLHGDISPGKPLWCRAQVVANNLPGHPEAVLLLAATQPGELVLPFALFPAAQPSPFTAVDAIVLTFSDCAPTSCTGTSPARPCTIGAIRLDTDLPTAARARSWGGLKLVYR